MVLRSDCEEAEWGRLTQKQAGEQWSSRKAGMLYTYPDPGAPKAESWLKVQIPKGSPAP